LLASGGFADGRGLAAALALGADGISMGTRFMCTVESPIHQRIKAAIVAGSERDTELIFRTMRNTSRVASNEVSRTVVAMEADGAVFDDIRHLVAGSRGRRVYEEGDPDAGVWTVGVVQGLVNDIPTVEELVQRIVRDAESIIEERLAGLLPQAELS
jgi:nitronate monooxygenase